MKSCHVNDPSCNDEIVIQVSMHIVQNNQALANPAAAEAAMTTEGAAGDSRIFSEMVVAASVAADEAAATAVLAADAVDDAAATAVPIAEDPAFFSFSVGGL